jgi:hypothetical protein|tara:strand:+ start:30 stop:704 length:675 start_codon:yes stop_codon:yes gene_type:complete
MLKMKDLIKEFTSIGGVVTAKPMSVGSFRTAKKSTKLGDIVEDIFGTKNADIDEQTFMESVGKYNEIGKQIYREGNLRDVAQHLSKLAKVAQAHTLRETDDWFDKITINRNMKELNGLASQFNKVATDAQSLQERMSGLYEDMGHILGRYYDISEMEEASKSYRHGDEHDGEDMDEGKKEEYEKFFNAALKKFDASSPAELSGDKKKEFFNYVDKEWSGSDESD